MVVCGVLFKRLSTFLANSSKAFPMFSALSADTSVF